MSDKVISKRIALVTGASSGIGKESARLLSQAGFAVGLLGRRLEMLQELQQEITQAGGEAWSEALDIRDEAAVSAFVNHSVARYGKIDLLVHSAGVFKMVPFEQTDPGFWDETISINLTGAYIVSRAVWPYIDHGQIIHISSVAGVQPFDGCAAYSASKYGLIGLAEVLALEGNKRDIRVHVICPGNTETPIWSDQAPGEVLERMMRPTDVAQTVLWLALSPPNVSFNSVIMRPLHNPWAKRRN
jgi:NADP-dependent 3-hydroxy acid dehydrogenase YdfG